MLVALTLLSSLSWASPTAIYGEDNRHEVYQEKNPLIYQSALSTAALISEDEMEENSGIVKIAGRTLGDLYKMCSTEKFRMQPIAANCSGTLVAKDIIMTAGHCYDNDPGSCKTNRWVFDYRVSRDNQPIVNVYPSSVYKCKEIIKLENDHDSGVDYALIRLDREVMDRSPVKIQSTKVKVTDELTLIGHPTGLPTKIADSGKVLKTFTNHFISNLDAFTVNSGSGVFNSKTGEVVGILSSGRMDYESKTGCTKPIVYAMEDGNEAVFKLDKIIELLKGRVP